MSYSSEVLADSPLAYWKLDEPSGETIAVDSANGHNLTHVGSVTRGAAPLISLGASVLYPGAIASRTEVVNDTAFRLNGNFSIEFWAKEISSGAVTYPSIMGYGKGVVGDGWLIYYQYSTKTIAFKRGGFDDSTGITLDTQAEHVVLTWNSSTKNLTVYKNGSPANVVNIGSGLATDTATTKLVFGCQWSTNGTTYSNASNIVLDEVAFYNSTLSGARVAAHYAARSVGSQILYPVSDVTTTGWTKVPSDAASFAATLDETSVDDTDYAQSPLNPSSSVFEVKLGATSDPVDNTNHVVTYRLQSVAAATSSVTVGLYEGATLISSWTETDVPATPTTYSHTLLSAEAANISSAGYSDLRLRFTVTAT